MDRREGSCKMGMSTKKEIVLLEEKVDANYRRTTRLIWLSIAIGIIGELMVKY